MTRAASRDETNPVDTDPVLVFGSVLRSLRERARLSQRELADRVYCSASLVSAIERGDKPAKLDLVERMDSALNADGMLIKVWPITTTGHYPSWFAYVAELEKEASQNTRVGTKDHTGIAANPGLRSCPYACCPSAR